MSNISYVPGDIFKTDKQVIVNTVNCVGVMGAGIAKTAKARYPQMYDDYVRKCKRKEVLPGVPYLWRNSERSGAWIINFPTKNHWRSPSEFGWLINGLECFQSDYKKWGITSIAFPALGCGNGGLSWLDVKPLMEKYLSVIDIPVDIFLPRLPKTEKAVEYALTMIQGELSDNLLEVSLSRSVFPHRDTWVNWCQAKELYLDVYSKKSADLKKIEFEIEKKFGVRIKFSLKLHQVKSRSTKRLTSRLSGRRGLRVRRERLRSIRPRRR